MALRLLALAFFGRWPLISDAASYHAMAVQLVRGDTFVAILPPGLPAYLALTYKLFGIHELIGRVAMLPLYVTLSLLIYALTRRFADGAAANLAVLLFAVYPDFVYVSVTPYTQLPVAVCLAAIVLLAIQGREHPTVWRLAALGLVLGWVTLIRPSSIVLVAVIPGILLLTTKRARAAIIPVVLAALLIASWLYKADRMAGQFIMINTANALNFYLGNNPYTPLYRTWWFGSHSRVSDGVPAAFSAEVRRIRALAPAAQDRTFQRLTLTYIGERPDLFALRTANRVRAYFAFDIFAGAELAQGYDRDKLLGYLLIAADAICYLLVMAPAVIYLFNRRRFGGDSGQILVILTVAIAYAVPYWLSFSHPTYHLPIMPLLGVFAAVVPARLAGGSPAAASNEPATGVQAELRRSTWIGLAMLAYIQVEWVFLALLKH